MADTALSDHSRQVIAGHWAGRRYTARDNGGVVKPGYIISMIEGDDTGQTWPDAVLADWEEEDDWDHATNLYPIGVALEKGSQDIDSLFADDEEFEYVALKSGAEVWIPIGTSGGAMQYGTQIYTSNTVPGHGVNGIIPITEATPTVNQLRALPGMRIGTCLGPTLADEAATNWVKVRLD